MDTKLFIAYQYSDDMNEPFVVAALQECQRFLTVDFYMLEPVEYMEFDISMRAYLQK